MVINKVRVINFTKLALAIGALTAAINGYIQVRKDQSNLLEVMSDKIDAIVLKVAYLEGRIDGLSHKEAIQEAEVKIRSNESPHPTPLVDVSSEVDKLYKHMPKNFDAVQMVIDEKIKIIKP